MEQIKYKKWEHNNLCAFCNENVSGGIIVIVKDDREYKEVLKCYGCATKKELLENAKDNRCEDYFIKINVQDFVDLMKKKQ